MATRWRDAPCGCTVIFDDFVGDEPVNPQVEFDCGKHGKLAPAEHLKAVLAFSRAMQARTTESG